MQDDATYFADRERTERALAAEAKDDASRAAHTALADAYRKRVRAGAAAIMPNGRRGIRA